MPDSREFDLNIERVLEHWTVAHAVRELIANALDEAALTDTDEPVIAKDEAGRWHIRDVGRGVRYEHLTQNENVEKLTNADKVVGKFGVGLKDALATLDRHDVGVRIVSRHGSITTARTHKHGFDDITTLHAVIEPPADPAMRGTDVILDGVDDAAVAEAKGLFRRYAGDRELESTPFGWVLERPAGGAARIYVNGLRVAEEQRYLFSYDITSPTKALRTALNRERTNVGRTAYTDRVKSILLAASSPDVANALADDLSRFASGTWHDETQLVDVGVHACQVLNALDRVVFLTPDELSAAREVVDRAEGDGFRVIVVPTRIRAKLKGLTDINGDPIVDLGRFREQWNESFAFTFVGPNQLSDDERAVYERTDDILALRGGRPARVREVAISSTMRLGAPGSAEALGVWEPAASRIVIKREQLASLERYAGTLLHEVAHAVSGTPDVSAGFEEALTGELGGVARQALES
jgi:hypothetical protein